MKQSFLNLIFDNADTYLAGTMAALTAPITVFAVVKFAQVHQANYDIDYALQIGKLTGSYGTMMAIAREEGSVAEADRYYNFNGGGTDYGPVIQGGVWNLFTVTHKIGFQIHQFWSSGNYDSLTQQYNIPLQTDGEIYLGALVDTNFQRQFVLDGSIAELIVFADSLTHLEKSAVENYLAIKYGISRDNALNPTIGKDLGIYVMGSSGAVVNFTWNKCTDLTANIACQITDNTGLGPKGTGLPANVYKTYWSFNAANFNDIFEYNVSFDLSKIPGITDYTDIEIYKTEGDPTSDTASWIKIPDYIIGDNSNKIITVGNLSSFSSFAIGSNTNPLPVELSSFTGLYNKLQNQVVLKWKTATEINNYGFEIQRRDNNNWVKIGFVNGAGNSNSPKEYTFTDKVMSADSYSYRLKQIDVDGKFEYSSVVEVAIDEFPNDYVLRQNYPNPFNPVTTIKFEFNTATKASLKVYDILGKEINTLFNGVAETGKVYEVEFNAGNLASGIYFYILSTPEKTLYKKMLLMK